MAKKTLSDCMIEILEPMAWDPDQRVNEFGQENADYNKNIKYVLETGFLAQMLKEGSFTGLLPNALEWFTKAEQKREFLLDKYRDDVRENYIPQELENAVEAYNRAETQKHVMQLLESELQRVYEHFLHREYVYTPHVAKKKSNVTYDEIQKLLKKAS